MRTVFEHLRSCDRRQTLGLAIGLFLLVVSLYPEISSDGYVRYMAYLEMLESDALPDVKYSLIQPLLTYPLAALGQLAGYEPAVSAGYFNFIIYVLTGLVVLPHLVDIAGRTVAMTFLLLLTAASMVPHHLQWYFGEVLTASGLWIGFLTLRGRRGAAPIAAFCVAIVNAPALLPALCAAALLHMYRRRDSRLLLAAMAAGGWIVLETILKHGSLTDAGYLSAGEAGYETIMPYSGQPGFSYPLFFGVLSVLFSFGKGLLFFIPGLFLVLSSHVRQRLRQLDLAWEPALCFTVVAICTYSMWWSWYGGSFWGPRFFLFLCYPACLILAVLLAPASNAVVDGDEGVVLPQIADSKITFGDQIAAAGVLLLSTWVGINGYVFGQSGLAPCWANDYAQEFLCWYTPEFSALWRPFVIGFDLADTRRLLFAGWQAAVAVVFLRRLWQMRSSAGSQGEAA